MHQSSCILLLTVRSGVCNTFISQSHGSDLIEINGTIRGALRHWWKCIKRMWGHIQVEDISGKVKFSKTSVLVKGRIHDKKNLIQKLNAKMEAA